MAARRLLSRDVWQSRSPLPQKMDIVKEQTKIRNRIHCVSDKYTTLCEYDDIFELHSIRWSGLFHIRDEAPLSL